MHSCKIDDSLIYEILKFISNCPDGRTTLRDIVDNTPLTDYDSGNAAIAEMFKMELLDGWSYGGVTTVVIDSFGRGKLFLDNYKHVSFLSTKEKWKERLWGCFVGIIIGVSVAAIIYFLGLS